MRAMTVTFIAIARGGLKVKVGVGFSVSKDGNAVGLTSILDGGQLVF